MLKSYFFVLLLILFPVMGSAQIDQVESERIRGVASFLLNRANENFLYIFEAKLKNNDYFQCYFPETYKFAGSGHLRSLLRSGGDIWKRTIDKDLERLDKHLLVLTWYKTYGYSREFLDYYLFLLQNLEIEIDGITYPLDQIRLDAPEKVKNIINEFYLPETGAISAKLNEQKDIVSRRFSDKHCFLEPITESERNSINESLVAEIVKYADVLKVHIDILKKYQGSFKFSREKIENWIKENDKYHELKKKLAKLRSDLKLRLKVLGKRSEEKTDKKLEKIKREISTLEQEVDSVEKRLGERAINEERLGKIIENVSGSAEPDKDYSAVLDAEVSNQLKKLTADFKGKFSNYIAFYQYARTEIEALYDAWGKDRPISNVVKAVTVEKILNRARKDNVIPFLTEFRDKEFNQFKRYMMFFAEVSEAKTAESVESLLEEITLPPVSFGKKRNDGEERWLITSYLGGALVSEESTLRKRDEYGGLFAPVGLEWTFGRHQGRSHSVMFSPLDFAHPVNLEIEDSEDAVKFSDIFVPGIYYSYGFKDWPLTVGFGVNKGKALKSSNRDEQRFLLFLAFDMPLFTVY